MECYCKKKTTWLKLAATRSFWFVSFYLILRYSSTTQPYYRYGDLTSLRSLLYVSMVLARNHDCCACPSKLYYTIHILARSHLANCMPTFLSTFFFLQYLVELLIISFDPFAVLGLFLANINDQWIKRSPNSSHICSIKFHTFIWFLLYLIYY